MAELNNKHYSVALDCCRWVAAFLVVISHVRHMLFANYDVIVNKSILMKAFYFVTGLGDEAVIVFFVLSGLLVGGGAAKKFLAGRYDAREYAIHRISRIYTVLIPALLIGGLLDWIGMLYFNDSTLYTAHNPYLTLPMSPDLVLDSLNLQTLFGNLLMTQHWLTPVFGSNGPLWSLTSEWWFYWLFWSLLGAASSNKSPVIRVAYAAFATAMAVVLPASVLLWFAIWLIGVAMAFSDRLRFHLPPLAGIAAFGMVLVGVRIARSTHLFNGDVDPLMPHFWLDLFVTAGCCVLLLSLRRIRSFRFGNHGFHRRMAGFSYTTYLVHFPLMVLTTAFLHDDFGTRFGQQPALLSGAYLLAMIIFLYLYSYVFAQWTEGKTTQVRHLLQSLHIWRLQPK